MHKQREIFRQKIKDMQEEVRKEGIEMEQDLYSSLISSKH